MRRYFNPPDANIDPRIEKWVVDKALSAGAIAPLMYVGAGATSVTIRDSQNLAFKVPRDSWELFVQDEAEFFKEASRISDISNHTARFVGYRNDVLVKEYIDGISRHNSSMVSRSVMDKMIIVHDHICYVMSRRGFACPEFTAGSYVTHRSRGLVLVDATFAGPIGRRLLPGIVRAARAGSGKPMEILSNIDRMYHEGFLSREAAKDLVATVIQNQPFDDVDRYVPYLLAELDRPLSSRAWGPFVQGRSNPYQNRRRNTLDDEIRRLERAYQADPSDLVAYEALLAARIRAGLPVDDPMTPPSSVEAYAILINARVRSGVTTLPRVAMAARLGHAGAMLVAPGLEEMLFNNHTARREAINALDDLREIVSFACDCAERILPIFEQEAPGDARPRLAIEAARNWVDAPSRKTAALSRKTADAVYYAPFAADAAFSAYAAFSAAFSVVTSATNAAASAVRASGNQEAERLWQSQRLAQYLVGEIPLSPIKKTARKRSR